MNITKSKKDDVYVNFIIQSEQLFTPSEVPVFEARKEYSLDTPILEKSSDYYLIVSSLSCPLLNVPVFIPDIQPNLSPWNNTDINKTIYSFTMEYNATFSDETYLTFIPQNINQTPFQLSPFQDRYSGYYDIYNYDIIADMINNTLKTCFANLAAKIALPTTDIPYFIWNDQQFKFSLVANKNYYDYFLPTPIKIYCNYQMFEIFATIPFAYLGGSSVPVIQGRNFLLYISNSGDNSISYPGQIDPAGDYYIMTQNISSVVSFYPMKSLFIRTNSIPVSPQISPLKPSTENANPNYVNKSKIILDIEPIIIGDLVKGRINVQYRDQTNECIDLVSDNPLTDIDLSIYWRDRFGLPHIVFLNYNQPANIKLHFIKKDLIKN